MNYIYSQVDRLKEPHAYMYTQFRGEEFLEAYLSSRLDVLNRCAGGSRESTVREQSLVAYSVPVLEQLYSVKSVDAGIKFKRVLAGGNLNSFSQNEHNVDIIPDLAKLLTLMTPEKSVSILDLLQALIAVQILDIKDDNTQVWLDRLVQRFEVTKKLYETYPRGFKKGEGSNKEIRLYWLFALALSLYYVRSLEIKYLSTLLKINDLLCSLPEHLLQKKIPENGLETVLATEVASILLVAENKGVSLELK